MKVTQAKINEILEALDKQPKKNCFETLHVPYEGKYQLPTDEEGYYTMPTMQWIIDNDPEYYESEYASKFRQFKLPEPKPAGTYSSDFGFDVVIYPDTNNSEVE